MGGDGTARFEDLEGEFAALVAEIEKLGPSAAPELPAEELSSPNTEEAPPPVLEPMLLPLCGSDVEVTLATTGAVLQFTVAEDGRALLLPIALETLEALAHKLAAALTALIEPEVETAE